MMRFCSAIAILGAAVLCAAYPLAVTPTSIRLSKRDHSYGRPAIVAQANLRKDPEDDNSEIIGKVWFAQYRPNGPVTVAGVIRGLDPEAKRGFHIHQSANFTDGCMSTGGHFNPFNRSHGARTDEERHAGDLGNIETNENGDAMFIFQQDLISFNGPTNIMDLAVVLHSGTDDLGLGGNATSLTTGNAGGRYACGQIQRLE